MAVLVSLLDRFQAREWRYFRASMFSALGAYGIAPVVHQWWLNSDVPQVKTALVYDLIMGATYLVRGWHGLRLPLCTSCKGCRACATAKHQILGLCAAIVHMPCMKTPCFCCCCSLVGPSTRCACRSAGSPASLTCSSTATSYSM